MTVTISLKEFFKTGQFGPIQLGMFRRQVEDLLGKPEYIIDIRQEVPDYHTAGIWTYGGMEFRFGNPVNLDEYPQEKLHHFMFKPGYLWSTVRGSVQLNKWIFRSEKGPNKARFVEALGREKIQFSDSGDFKVVMDTNYPPVWAIPLDEPHFADEDADIHSVIILSSGVEVIFDGKRDLIDRTYYGASWDHVRDWRKMAGPLPAAHRLP